MTLSDADDPLLQAVGRFHYLTAMQATRLLYRPGSLTYARERLARLAQDDYLHRRALGRVGRAGSGAAVYTLGPRGKRYLERLGLPVPARLRQAVVDDLELPHLRHSLAITDVLITLERLCRDAPDEFRLDELRHEVDLKPLLLHGGQVAPVPDAWATLRRRRPDGAVGRLSVAFEVDRGTEHVTVWRRKTARWQRWAASSYATTFGTSALLIAVVAISGEARSRTLLQWTEDELRTQGHQADGQRFRITGLAPATADPRLFFCGAHWRAPFDERLRPLWGEAATGEA